MENTVCEFSEDFQKSHQGVFGISARPADPRRLHVLRIEKDGSLIKGRMKVSPHFDERMTVFYLKTNEELVKPLSSIKSKEQCEQLKVLIALDLRYLNGCDYTWEKPDATSLPKSSNPLAGTIRSGEAAAAADESASDVRRRPGPDADGRRRSLHRRGGDMVQGDHPVLAKPT